MGKLLSTTACLGLALAVTTLATNAQQMLIVAENVPTGLNYNGPSTAMLASQRGTVTLLAPLVDYANGEAVDAVTIPDFTAFEGRLAER